MQMNVPEFPGNGALEESLTLALHLKGPQNRFSWKKNVSYTKPVELR